MSSIPNLVCLNGKVKRLDVKKRGGDTQALRAGRVAAAAIGKRCKFFAMRWDREWHCYAVSGPVPTLTAPSREAAEMWLMHREHARD
jgi:hypothetical protein